jgi:ribosomal protein L35
MLFGLFRTAFTSPSVNAVTRFMPLKPLNGGFLSNLVSNTLIQPIRGLKTHKGAAKRWRKTGSKYKAGWKRGQAGKRHLNHGMGAKRIRNLRGTVRANKSQASILKRVLPFA